MSDPARVLLCSFEVLPGPTGASRRLAQYAARLSERFEVVMMSAKTANLPHIEKFHDTRLLRVPVGEGDLPSQANAFDRAVRRQLESEEYALVHFTDPYGGYALCELKEKYAYKVLYEAQSFPSYELVQQHPELEGDRKFQAMVRRQELFCLTHSDQVISGSNVTRHYVQALGVAPEKLKVLRAPVQLAAFEPGAMGEPTGEPMRVIYLGSQARYQGLETLFRGVQLASREVPLRLSVVGPRIPERQARLEELVVELQLEGSVELKASVPHAELPALLANADLGVVPLEPVERNQMQGGALAKASEYLAAGRPVVAADLPVTRELLPSEAALFFRAGDAKHLAERLVLLARDPAQRQARGERARAYAQERLDSAGVCGKVVELYDRLLKPARKLGASTPAPPLPAPSSFFHSPSPAARPTQPEPQPEARPPPIPSTAFDEDEITQQVAISVEEVEVTPKNLAPPPPSAPTPPPLPLAKASPPPLPVAAGLIDEKTTPGETAPGTFDPWLALLVHGWCPPEGTEFARHAPPTNFPGREEPSKP